MVGTEIASAKGNAQPFGRAHCRTFQFFGHIRKLLERIQKIEEKEEEGRTKKRKSEVKRR